MHEGKDYYLKTRPKWRRVVGRVLCFFGLHRDYFSDADGTTMYNYCVRCGAYKENAILNDMPRRSNECKTLNQNQPQYEIN